jgi:hypothetical protein
MMCLLRLVSLLIAALLCCQQASAFLPAPLASGGTRNVIARRALGDPVEVQFTESNKKITMPGGTPLPQVFVKAGVKIRYNCKQGQCGTCTTIIDGRQVRVCSSKLDPFKKYCKIKK